MGSHTIAVAVWWQSAERRRDLLHTTTPLAEAFPAFKIIAWMPLPRPAPVLLRENFERRPRWMDEKKPRP